MGHLLATVNPQAAAEIDRAPEHVEQRGHSSALAPGMGQPKAFVGQSVQFWYPAGQARAGKTHTAAIVTKVHDSGDVDLVVVFDADDFIQKQRVPLFSGGADPGWKPVPEETALFELRMKVNAIADEVAMLSTLVVPDEEPSTVKRKARRSIR